MSEPTITLYSAATPNGLKVSMLLEELGVPYNVRAISFDKKEQKEPWFLEINPNGRIPALTDKFSDGREIRLFESAAIMQYLVDRYDKDHKLSYPAGSREHYEVLCWLAWVNGGIGPMQGQANHFFRYAPEKIKYGIDRYQNETRRLYKTLETHLKQSGSPYIVGDKLTNADLSAWGWIAASGWAGVDKSDFPLINAWEERIEKRPGSAKGIDVPEKYKLKDAMKNSKMLEEEVKKSSDWVMSGMADDSKK